MSCYRSIHWQTLSPPIPHTDPADWDARWQSAILYPAHTATTYQYRAQLLQSLTQQYRAAVADLLSHIDIESWSGSKNVIRTSNIELRRLTSSTEYIHWKSRLRSYELIHMSQRDYHRHHQYIHTPLCALICTRSDRFPIVAMALVPNLDLNYHSVSTLISDRIQCQNQLTTGRFYFMGDAEHNDFLIPYQYDDVYIRSELILNHCISRYSITDHQLDIIITKKMKTLARALDRLDLDTDVISRGQKFTDCIHFHGLNYRFLSRVQMCVKQVSIRLYIFQELICRSMKYLIRNRPAIFIGLDTDQYMHHITEILLHRYQYQCSLQEEQIISSFLHTREFWVRILHDALGHDFSDSISIFDMKSQLTKLCQEMSVSPSMDIETYNMTLLMGDLVSIQSGLERWRCSIVRTYHVNHHLNIDLLAKRSHLLLLWMHARSDYIHEQVQRIIEEISRITCSHPSRWIALSNCAIILSYLQQYRPAFAILNNIQADEYHYLLASAQIQSNRGLLQEYMNTLQTLLQRSSSLGNRDLELDAILQLATCRIEMNQFDSVSNLLIRAEIQLRSAHVQPAYLIRFLICLSKCYTASGNYVVAKQILQHCQHLAQTHLHGSDRIYLVYCLSDLAEIHQQQFKQSVSAASLLQKCIAELQKIHDSSSTDRYMISALRQLSSVLSETGQHQLADRMLRLAIIRGQSLINSNSTNFFEIGAFVEIATSYAQLREHQKSSEIWLQAWNRISSSSSLYRTYDCLTISLNYCNEISEPEHQLDILQTALEYANLIYTEQHDRSCHIQLRIARIQMELQQYEQAGDLLHNLHLRLNSHSCVRNSNIHVQCWTLQSQLMLQLRQYLELKSLLHDRIQQLEYDPICLPILHPTTLFDLIAAQIRINQKLCEFSDTNRIIERAKSLCDKIFEDSVHGHIVLRNMSRLFSRLHRPDLAKSVIVDIWERCKLMAFHEQYLPSDSLQIRHMIWFMEFIRCTILYSNILGDDHLIGLAYRALQDVLDLVLELPQSDRNTCSDLLLDIRLAQARLMFRKNDDLEEMQIIQEMLANVQIRADPVRCAALYCRMCCIQHRAGDPQQRLHYLKLAWNLLLTTSDKRGRWLLNLVRRTLKRRKSLDFHRLADVDVYDLESHLDITDAKMQEEISDHISADLLFANRAHLQHQLHLYEQSSIISHDYLARTLLELAQSYRDERLYEDAGRCLARAKSIIKSRQLAIKIPDLHLCLKPDVTVKSSSSSSKMKTAATITSISPTKKKVKMKWKRSPYLNGRSQLKK